MDTPLSSIWPAGKWMTPSTGIRRKFPVWGANFSRRSIGLSDVSLPIRLKRKRK